MAKDKNFVYQNGEKISIKDPKTFEMLDMHYGKDKFNVYYISYAIDILEGADSKTFQSLDKEMSEYAKDKKMFIMLED